MSFGFSPTDVVNLVQLSTRIYVAFKDANDNSERQVAGLVRAFTNFHNCLLEVSELLQEYGKPLPFQLLHFQETLQRCQATIEPYASHLVDRKMSTKKALYIIKYIGKETEIENLRTEITDHFQALQMYTSYLQLRLHLEATRQTQRLLDTAPFRAMSFGGHHYTTNANAASSSNALPAPSDADQLYRDWQIFSRWLKNEEDRLLMQGEGDSLMRPLSLGGTPVAASAGDEQTSAILFHLRRELEDAIVIEENRAKRAAVERRTHLAPSDAVRREMRSLRPIPPRNHSGYFSQVETREQSLGESTATIRPAPASTMTSSPTGSPQLESAQFDPVDWGSISPPGTSPRRHDRTPSVSTVMSSPGSVFGSPVSDGRFGIGTADTTPEDAARVLRPKLSAASLVSMALGEGALQWTKLCKKVDVERTISGRVESRVCDLHWRYREDAGISIRSVYRSSSSNETKVWITQHFGATGPSIPLTTTHIDGDVSIEFPQGSFGRLDKRCTDIKYTVADTDSSLKLQTLLYTNNGQDEAELLYDRPVVHISSNLNKPECRAKNVRLWRRKEPRTGLNGPEVVEVLFLLFYSSALPAEKAHWVEEPHYIFQWLDGAVHTRESEKLRLIVSKEPSKWAHQKVASSAPSVSSFTSIFGGRPNGAAGLNRFGYGELEIRFQSKKDSKAFLDVWRQYVRPLAE